MGKCYVVLYQKGNCVYQVIRLGFVEELVVVVGGFDRAMLEIVGGGNTEESWERNDDYGDLATDCLMVEEET